MSELRAGSDIALASRNRRRARTARHLGLLTLLFSALAVVGIVSGGAALGRWDLPFVEDPAAADAPSVAASYSGPMTPVCGAEGTIAIAEPGATTVAVLNGTGREGLAQSVADELAARGFLIDRVGSTQLPAQLTNVRYPPEQLAQAVTTGAHVGTSDMAVDVDRSVVTITLGSDFVAATAADQAGATLAAGALPGCPGVVTVPEPPAAVESSAAAPA